MNNVTVSFNGGLDTLIAHTWWPLDYLQRPGCHSASTQRLQEERGFSPARPAPTAHLALRCLLLAHWRPGS